MKDFFFLLPCQYFIAVLAKWLQFLVLPTFFFFFWACGLMEPSIVSCQHPNQVSWWLILPKWTLRPEEVVELEEVFFVATAWKIKYYPVWVIVVFYHLETWSLWCSRSVHSFCICSRVWHEFATSFSQPSLSRVMNTAVSTHNERGDHVFLFQ